MRAVFAGWLLLGLLAAAPALARDFKVEPGEVPELREDEGFVLVALDTSDDVRYLSVKSATSLFTGDRLKDIKAGRSWGLYVMPAGKYRWDSLHVGWVKWVMREEPEFQFESRPGEVTYAGDLIYRNMRFHVANRGLAALDWLEKEHPAIAARYRFEYSGHYPDPFPAFYAAERGKVAVAAAERDRTVPPPAPGKLPMPVETLWRAPQLESITLGPDGFTVAGVLRIESPGVANEDTPEGETPEPVTIWSVELYDLAKGDVRRLATSRGPISDLTWLDERTFGAQVRILPSVPPAYFLFRRQDDGQFASYQVPRTGRLVDVLEDEPGHMLFASRGSRGEPMVHRLDFRSAKALKAYKFPMRERVNAGLEDDFAWFTDARGAVRAALVQREDEMVLVHGGDGHFEDVLVLDGPEAFQPMLVSGDGRLIYGTSEEGRAQRDLVEFDPVARRITRTVFSKPGVDIVGPVFGAGNQPVGASYYEGGQLVTEYFDDGRRQVAEALARTFRDRTVATLGRSRDGKRLLLWVDGSDQPPQIYHLDVDKGRASLVEEAAPWLSELAFTPAQVMKVRSRDGLELEAFLTLPAGEGKRPLVVMPHGGPIGVADRRHFNPEVQFLASLGYAVLQVNFRGSEGYGKAFEEAGHRSLGTGIEDDIDAAIDAALARFPLDPGRMCMVGASYGGYSGLMSAIRWPGRFRCVVSMSGVSDRTLFFTASDAGRNAELRPLMEKLVGDPRTQPELMRETSPLFRYRELKVPLMLVHGGEDIRVDYEHTRRLVRMLGLAGKPPVLLHLEKDGHSLDREGTPVKVWQGVAGFLREHLGGAAPAATAP